MLEALGCVRAEGGAYLLGPEVDFDAIPKGILDLYEIAPEEILTDRSTQLQLSRWLAELGIRQGEPSGVRRLVEGAILLPLLIALQKASPRAPATWPENLETELRRELNLLFVRKGWGSEEGQQFCLSGPATELIERAYVMAIAASYRPMLARVEELLYGNAAAVFQRDATRGEAHVDRQMNVIASGFQHQRYFREAEHHLLTIFDEMPLARQPGYIADMGCGDGTFLRREGSKPEGASPGCNRGRLQRGGFGRNGENVKGNSTSDAPRGH
jgi:hypothetical protein